MDPLSIIASTIGIAAPIVAGLQMLRDARYARTEILLLANEVAEISILLQELGQVLQKQKQYSTAGPNPRLIQALDLAKTKLEELSNHISGWNAHESSPQASSVKTRAFKWIKIGSKVKTFKDDLQRIRSQLMAVLSSLNL
jgi:hypothetical protein